MEPCASLPTGLQVSMSLPITILIESCPLLSLRCSRDTTAAQVPCKASACLGGQLPGRAGFCCLDQHKGAPTFLAMVLPRIMALMTSAAMLSNRSAPLAAQSPTLSPTRSAITAGFLQGTELLLACVPHCFLQAASDCNKQQLFPCADTGHGRRIHSAVAAASPQPSALISELRNMCAYSCHGQDEQECVHGKHKTTSFAMMPQITMSDASRQNRRYQVGK